MIENSFVYAVNIAAEKNRKKEARRAIKENKLREILIKKNLKLAFNATRADFNKSELKLISDLGYYEYLIMNERKL